MTSANWLTVSLIRKRVSDEGKKVLREFCFPCIHWQDLRVSEFLCVCPWVGLWVNVLKRCKQLPLACQLDTRQPSQQHLETWTECSKVEARGDGLWPWQTYQEAKRLAFWPKPLRSTPLPPHLLAPFLWFNAHFLSSFNGESTSLEPTLLPHTHTHTYRLGSTDSLSSAFPPRLPYSRLTIILCFWSCCPSRQTRIGRPCLGT